MIILAPFFSCGNGGSVEAVADGGGAGGARGREPYLSREGRSPSFAGIHRWITRRTPNFFFFDRFDILRSSQSDRWTIIGPTVIHAKVDESLILSFFFFFFFRCTSHAKHANPSLDHQPYVWQSTPNPSFNHFRGSESIPWVVQRWIGAKGESFFLVEREHRRPIFAMGCILMAWHSSHPYPSRKNKKKKSICFWIV